MSRKAPPGSSAMLSTDPPTSGWIGCGRKQGRPSSRYAAGAGGPRAFLAHARTDVRPGGPPAGPLSNCGRPAGRAQGCSRVLWGAAGRALAASQATRPGPLLFAGPPGPCFLPSFFVLGAGMDAALRARSPPQLCGAREPPCRHRFVLQAASAPCASPVGTFGRRRAFEGPPAVVPARQPTRPRAAREGAVRPIDVRLKDP
ncbi:unnamed protein product, partial [Amoebophrya sp. A120]|eukprot:GSA120T00001525001.1